jgi:hypothetical protein
MAANNLGPTDLDIASQKIVLQTLQLKVRVFGATYLSMQPKERAKALLEIQKTFESLARFFDKMKGLNIQNTGTRFAAENLKQSYYSLSAVWKKIESAMNSSKAS